MGEYNPENHLGITYQQAMGKMHAPTPFFWPKCLKGRIF
jgi:hypothetical protein